MVAITFPTTHSPGLRASEGAGRLYNCYAEPMGPGARDIAVLHRVPGLASWGTTTRTGYRGSIEIAGVLYSAFSGKLEKHTSAGGTSVNVGNLSGTKKGFFARNNAVTPDKVFVDPDGNIATFTPTAVTAGYPDPDLPAVNSVTSIDGYLVFTAGDGKAWATDLNTTAVNALSFGAAEAKPDGLTRGITWGGRLYLMGSATIEVWTDQGLSPFPFARSEVIPRGIAGPYCVTGFEDNFSKGIYLIGDDNGVHRLDGYTVTKVSPPDLDGLIEAVSDKTTLEMCSYTSRGHAFIQISCPAWTWTFNLNNEKWHERPSYLQTRSRISGTIYAFSKWLAGDTDSGNIVEITNTSHEETGDPIRCDVWSTPVHKFPQRVRVASMWFDFAVGVGEATGEDPTATDPSCEIDWSDDGGQTFSIPRVRKIGRQSIGKARVRINQCGITGSQGRIIRVRFSDPVHFGLMGGEMVSEVRAA
jgi:hypothetical protein